MTVIQIDDNMKINNKEPKVAGVTESGLFLFAFEPPLRTRGPRGLM